MKHIRKKIHAKREFFLRSQSGLNAAILVAIISGLIILYIVFLPAAEREKFVGQGGESSANSDGSNNLIFKAVPGALSASQNLDGAKKIPNIFLVETTNAKVLDAINPFIIRNGWFDKRDSKIAFTLDDIQNTDNVILTFTSKKRQGILTVKLNGNVIFENELASDTIEPVRLDKSLLGKTNTLEFSVSSVGIKFWAANEYSLENIKIIGDITDTSRQESANIFTLSDSEISSINKAVLKFIPYCKDVNDIGALEIFVNSKKIFSSVPSCDNAYKQDIPKVILSEGENNVLFKTKKGSYGIEQISISLDFKEPKVKTYFFEINSSVFNKIKQGESAVLTLKFADSKAQKRLKLDVNGRIETIETDKSSISKSINGKVSEGNNFVRLEPLEDVEVAELRIELA